MAKTTWGSPIECGERQVVKSLMRSFKAKYEIQLHREVEWPYMRGKYVLTAHTPISLGTIGKIVGIFSYSRLVCWPVGWELWELTQQLKTAASRLVAGLEELWEGCGTRNCAGSEGGSASGLVSSLADYSTFWRSSDDERNSRCRHQYYIIEEDEHLF